MSFELSGIDHIHINVKNRELSESWYKKVFGFKRAESLAFWAKDGGPLIIQNETGTIHLALFESDDIQSTIIAFNVSFSGFASFIKHLSNLGISVKPIDHEISWSIYFKDPDGNPYEVTTYDYDEFAKNA